MNYRLEAIYESMYTREGESAVKMHSTKRNSTMNKNWQLEAVYEKIIEQTLIPERLDVKGYKSKKDVAQAITNNNPNFKIGSISPNIRIQPIDAETAKNKDNLKQSLIDSLDDIHLVLMDTLKPKEPGNPSGTFNAYKVKDTISDNEFIVVISGGAAGNKGMTYERDILESFKQYFNAIDKAETVEEKEQIEKPSMLEKLEDNLDVKFVGVGSATFDRAVKRPLTIDGANDRGIDIADITLIGSNNKPYYISLKDVDGKTVGNAGAAGMFNIEDNEVDFINKERDGIGGELMKAAGVRIPYVERGLSDYAKKRVSSPELAKIEDTTKNSDLNTLHKFIESAFDYGYIYVKRKNMKDDLEIEDLSDKEKLIDFIGDITKVQVKYPFYRSDAWQDSRKSVSIIMTTDKNIYSFDIRNKSRKIIPTEINLVKLGSNKELRAATSSAARIDTGNTQLTNLLNK
jgi:hypothetical protein